MESSQSWRGLLEAFMTYKKVSRQPGSCSADSRELFLNFNFLEAMEIFFKLFGNLPLTIHFPTP